MGMQIIKYPEANKEKRSNPLHEASINIRYKKNQLYANLTFLTFIRKQVLYVKCSQFIPSKVLGLLCGHLEALNVNGLKFSYINHEKLDS